MSKELHHCSPKCFIQGMKNTILGYSNLVLHCMANFGKKYMIYIVDGQTSLITDLMHFFLDMLSFSSDRLIYQSYCKFRYAVHLNFLSYLRCSRCKLYTEKKLKSKIIKKRNISCVNNSVCYFLKLILGIRST